MEVYCFTGYPGAGKSVASTVARANDIPVIEMGAIVRDRATEDLEADSDSATIGDWASTHRDEHGDDIFAHYTATRVNTLDTETVVIDGLRSDAELAVFQEAFETVTVALVIAPFKTRLQRLQERGRDGEDAFTAEELRDRDARESLWGLGAIITDDLYDIRLQNDADLASFEEAVRSVLLSPTPAE